MEEKLIWREKSGREATMLAHLAQKVGGRPNSSAAL